MTRTPMKRQGPKGRAKAARIKALRPALLAAWGGRCAVPWCRRAGRLDLDHVVKRSQGGPDDASNLVPLCRPCHQAKDRPSGGGWKLMILPHDGARPLWMDPASTLRRAGAFWFWRA